MFRKGRVVQLLCVISMLMIVSAFAQGTISVTKQGGAAGPAMGAPGKKAVKLEVRGPGDDIAGMNFTIQYDADFLENPKASLGTLSSTGFSIDQFVVAPGEFRVIIFPSSAAPIPTFTAGEGVMANLEFDVKSVTTGFCTSVNLILAKGTQNDVELIGISNAAAESITDQYTTQDGAIKVTRPGDFNSDGNVNIQDYGMLAAGWGTVYNIVNYGQLAANWLQNCP